MISIISTSVPEHQTQKGLKDVIPGIPASILINILNI